MNVWIFYVSGYVIAYSARMWAEKTRGEPFEDPELSMQKGVLIPALIWMVIGLIITIFTPITGGLGLTVGILVLVIGMIIVLLAFYSFAMKSGLTVSLIHKYSRNPNYIGWDLYMGGLAILGWSNSIWSYLCLAYFVYTVIYLHLTILVEEKFLANKYGEEYRGYLTKAPRYFWIF